MAIAFLSPQDRAKVERQEDQYRRMNSVDPVERYKAKEEVMSGYAAELSKAMTAQAEQTARAYQAEIRRCEEADRRNNPYKPLPKGAKVTKSY